MIDQKNLEPKMIPFNFAFGAIVVIGGVIGYFTAQSLPSLAAGLFFGNLLMLTVWGCTPKNQEKSKSWGFYLAVIVSVFLLIFFILRLLKTGKPMPAAVIIPLAVLGILGNSLVLHRRSLQKNDSE